MSLVCYDNQSTLQMGERQAQLLRNDLQTTQRLLADKDVRIKMLELQIRRKEQNELNLEDDLRIAQEVILTLQKKLVDVNNSRCVLVEDVKYKNEIALSATMKENYPKLMEKLRILKIQLNEKDAIIKSLETKLSQKENITNTAVLATKITDDTEVFTEKQFALLRIELETTKKELKTKDTRISMLEDLVRRKEHRQKKMEQDIETTKKELVSLKSELSTNKNNIKDSILALENKLVAAQGAEELLKTKLEELQKHKLTLEKNNVILNEELSQAITYIDDLKLDFTNREVQYGGIISKLKVEQEEVDQKNKIFHEQMRILKENKHNLIIQLQVK